MSWFRHISVVWDLVSSQLCDPVSQNGAHHLLIVKIVFVLILCISSNTPAWFLCEIQPGARNCDIQEPGKQWPIHVLVMDTNPILVDISIHAISVTHVFIVFLKNCRTRNLKMPPWFLWVSLHIDYWVNTMYIRCCTNNRIIISFTQKYTIIFIYGSR